jgi:hypothetical protein
MPGLGILDRRGESMTRIGLIPEKLRYESAVNFSIMDTLKQRVSTWRERWLKR